MYKDIIDTIGFVESYDPELGAAMQREAWAASGRTSS